jgi:trimeric autotransporter adhesin
MASTYSSNLKIELMATGENSGTWGTITNTNMGTAVEEAIVGYGNPDYLSDANLTLTISNSNATQTARALVLNVTSGLSLTATRELVVPTAQKPYVVQNNTTGSQSILVKTTAGTGITVPNGFSAYLYTDGTNVVQMADFMPVVRFNSLLGNGGTSVTAILDEDNMASDSATALATQQSIKAYVDAQVGSFDTLAEVLAQGNTTGGTDLAVSAGDDITFTATSKAIFGTGGDLEVYHDGSNAYATNTTGSVIVGASGLSVKNAAGTETQITSAENGAVTAYYDNSAKLATTSTGIDVTGDVGGDTLTISGAGSIQGLTVGRGAGAVATNTVVGASALAANTSGNQNIAIGISALTANTTGADNTAIGRLSAFTNTTGNYNTALGSTALAYTTTGSSNTAIGYRALQENTTASENTAVGYQAGYSNTTGTVTAIGKGALYANTTGTQNTAVGLTSLTANTTGTLNAAFGDSSLQDATTADGNTAVGSGAQRFTTTGAGNVSVGRISLFYNTTGASNVAVGKEALFSNTTADNNTAVGYQALTANTTAANNTAVGYAALTANTTGTQNVAVDSHLY